MSKGLTNSALDRQNILNNTYTLREIEKATHITGIPFEGKTMVLKNQLADFFEVTPRTIDNYIENYSNKLPSNGYGAIKGNRLKLLKSAIENRDVHETYFANIKKT